MPSQSPIDSEAPSGVHSVSPGYALSETPSAVLSQSPDDFSQAAAMSQSQSQSPGNFSGAEIGGESCGTHGTAETIKPNYDRVPGNLLRGL
jgi:hypothetical protein